MRTDSTRVVSIRVNDKRLIELIQLYYNSGWEVKSVGGFVKDLINAIHEQHRERGEIEEITLNEAHAMMQEIGVGKANPRNLSWHISRERLEKEEDPHFRPEGVNQKQNERRRFKRQLSESTMELYNKLTPEYKNELDNIITPQMDEDQIRNMIESLLGYDNNDSESESENEDLMNTPSDQLSKEQLIKRREKEDQQQLNQMKNELATPPQDNQT